jgi:hypothetical protein
MINARRFCESVCSHASKAGIGLRFNKTGDGYAWHWYTGHLFPIVGAASPCDNRAALFLACEDLSKAMGWEYSE